MQSLKALKLFSETLLTLTTLTTASVQTYDMKLHGLNTTILHVDYDRPGRLFTTEGDIS
ncbi:hypothetical protein RBJ15_09400 [Pantoea sp. BS_4]|uniref:hypothetical protein n=1 Tax=Pantoea TaxID=53335 RepID=UPI0015626FAF|nr:hypothetical protein [Pantoea stewartii]